MPKQQGFTLVELLAAVLVIGILATIAIMTFTGPRKTVDLQTGQTTLASVSNRMLQWGSSNQSNFKTADLSTAQQDASNLTSIAKNKLKIDTGANYDWASQSNMAGFLTAVNSNVQGNNGMIYVGGCDQTSSTDNWVCNNVITCIRYFENGRPLCSEQIAYLREGVPLDTDEEFTNHVYKEGTGTKSVRRFLVPKSGITASTPINQAFYIIGRTCGTNTETGGTWPEKPNTELTVTQMNDMSITAPCSTDKNTLDEDVRPGDDDGQQECSTPDDDSCYRNYGS